MSFLQQSRSGGVFGRFDLAQWLGERTQKLRVAVENYDAENMLSRPVQDLVDEFVELVGLEAPVVQWDRAEQVESEETTIEVPHDIWRGFEQGPSTRTVHATRVMTTVPISGTMELFGANGNPHLTRSWDKSSIQDGELVLWNEWTNPTEDCLLSWWEQEQSAIDRQLEPVQSAVKSWCAALPGQVRSLIDQRRQRLLRNRGLEGALGLRVRRRSDRPKPVPVQRKKVATRRARRDVRSKPFQPEPALEDQIYLEIIDIICSFGRQLERSPRVAQKYDEEELRDQILVQLNGHFEGDAGGELFNGAGKTDILIRQDDRNVFIGECKFWEGERRFPKAIDQLCSYLVWRDSKAAIVLFIKRKDPSAVVVKAQSAIRAHPMYKREGPPSPNPESYTTFTLYHRDDDQREIHLALIPIAIRPGESPTPSSVGAS